MRVVMLSKALVVGTYQRKLEELAALPDVELVAVVPPFWREGRHSLALERLHTHGYELRVLPMALNGHYHLHWYRGLGAALAELRPDVLHADEEPYNLATAQALWLAGRLGARRLFFTWQNICRRLPPPFAWFERYCHRAADWAIAGSHDAAGVLRAKGYAGPLSVVPQFGVDPEHFCPSSRPRVPASPGVPTPPRPFTVGFAGRLVPEKGLDVLLDAVFGLGGDWRLELIGAGPLADHLARRARAAGYAGCVRIGPQPSTAMPERLRAFDVLVLPSLTRPNWREQFGRALVEAMACGVAVVGSDSGEIPQVIGDAGLVVPEGDILALRAALGRLRDDPALRQTLAARGRERVLAQYTQRQIAHQTYEVYRAVLGQRCASA
ncbi:MAG: glycosyltransferase family 4 protein [Chloroflexi bacterium]|nr:glycosyltransferase family 4 protein [Chloroflexota bacterium]